MYLGTVYQKISKASFNAIKFLEFRMKQNSRFLACYLLIHKFLKSGDFELLENVIILRSVRLLRDLSAGENVSIIQKRDVISNLKSEIAFMSEKLQTMEAHVNDVICTLAQTKDGLAACDDHMEMISQTKGGLAFLECLYAALAEQDERYTVADDQHGGCVRYCFELLWKSIYPDDDIPMDLRKDLYFFEVCDVLGDAFIVLGTYLNLLAPWHLPNQRFVQS